MVLEKTSLFYHYAFKYLLRPNMKRKTKDPSESAILYCCQAFGIVSHTILRK